VRVDTLQSLASSRLVSSAGGRPASSFIVSVSIGEAAESSSSLLLSTRETGKNYPLFFFPDFPEMGPSPSSLSFWAAS
jgi:hypothetical protein